MANEYCSFSSDDAEVNFLLKVVVVVAFFDPPLFFSLLVFVVVSARMTTETSHPSPMKCHIIIDKTLSDNSSSPPNSS